MTIKQASKHFFASAPNVLILIAIYLESLEYLPKFQRSRFLIGADRSILTIFTNRLLILLLFHREQICSER